MRSQSSPRATLKRLLSRTLGEQQARSLNWRTRELLGSAYYALNSDGRRSRRVIESLRNRHDGNRCFIIGNGPSLRDMDLSPLRNEYTFGLNRIYLLFEKLGFPTTFLVSVNRYVSEQSGSEMITQPCLKFLSWRAGRPSSASDDLAYLRTIDRPGFSTDPVNDGVWEGATVTYVALQLAYYFGFSEVILIGVDHSFSTGGPPHKLVTSTAGDPDHFDSSYFGPGYRWQLPDLETSEIAYDMARRHFERAGRIVVDATVGGKLQVFPKVEYTKVLGAGWGSNAA